MSKLFECMYCTPHGLIPGQIELLYLNKSIMFTPSSTVSLHYQCIIHLSDCDQVAAVSSEHDEHYLQIHLFHEKNREKINFEKTKNLFFQFFQKSILLTFTRNILDLKSSLSSLSVDLLQNEEHKLTVVPYYSSNLINLTNPTIPTTRNHTSTLLLSPPKLVVCATDKPAVEFRGQYLLTPEWAADIKELVPLEFRFCEWRLIFSPKIHGISIPSFFRHFSERQSTTTPSVMIISDSKNDCVFGAFCMQSWENTRRYFGSRENFLFSLKKSNIIKTEYFPWSCCGNTLFQFADDKRLVLGGGGGGAGIVIFDNWLRGTSFPCETFAMSNSLCCDNEFVVGDIEFWGLNENI